MDKELRNTLKNTVTKCRKLLEEAIGELLQGRFGIHSDGAIEDASRLTHLSSDELRYREEVLAHLEHIKASGLKPKAAAAQLIREAAFTHLNRLCAYKMMAERGLMQDPVGKGLKSRGFLFYLADHPEDETLYKSSQQDLAFRHYLEWINDSFASEIGVLFAREDVATPLFPPHRVIEEVLELINSTKLQLVWAQDETIGWIFQYFTPKELRDKARKESAAPRNSYEMSFRNQFFTPRYVVEFLVDNTLGRTWYEMRYGKTSLADKCRYLAINTYTAVQDDNGEATVNLIQRRKKDPRTIKVLDPACGSGHFLLYCFDLFLTVYEEAYSDADLGITLQQEFPDADEFKRQIPRLIVAHNLHGIDIDRRVIQLAALALWLRAQRAFHEMGLGSERPGITKTNLVCAEPMPGEQDLFDEFIRQLAPHPLAKLTSDLLRKVFDRMKLAGEAGALVRIEDDIREPIEEARKQWQENLRETAKREQELARKGVLFEYEKERQQRRLIFDPADITDEKVWNEVEAEVVSVLRDYAQQTTNGIGLSRRLFAEDAEQGFAFIDLCRQKFDVVLMNPPFGDASIPSKTYIDETYGDTKGDVYKAFVECFQDRLVHGGLLGIISSRTGFFLSTSCDWRERIVLRLYRPLVLADFGMGVLDAMVETAAYVLRSLNNEESKHLTLRIAKQLEIVPTDKKDRFSTRRYQDTFSLKRHQATGELESLHLAGFIKPIDGHFPRWVLDRSRIATADAPVDSAYPSLFCLRLLEEVDKDTAMLKVLNHANDTRGYLVSPKSFNQIPNAPFSYWVTNGVRKLFTEFPGFKSGNRNAVNGLTTGDDFRFVRCAWEISPVDKCPPSAVVEFNSGEPRVVGDWGWFSYAKGGETSPYYVDFPLVLNWRNGGQEMKAFSGTIVRNSSFFLSAGLTWPLRSSQFGPQCRPRLSIFSVRGYSITAPENELLSLLGLCNSRIFDYLFKTSLGRFGFPEFVVGVLHQLPVPPSFNEIGLDALAGKCISLKKRADTSNEISHAFYLPGILQGAGDTLMDRINAFHKTTSDILHALSVNQRKIDDLAFTLYDLNVDDRRVIEASPLTSNKPPDEEDKSELESEEEVVNSLEPIQLMDSLVSYGLGCTFGRWDVRIALADFCPPDPSGPFAPLPVCAPGALTGENGLPVTEAPDGYPLRLDADGISVDDPHHDDDVVLRVSGVFELLWPHRANEREHEACELLGVNELREYFRKPAAGGFWMNHVRRYSKSRRKAPIYWYLRSSKGNYAIWLYYHRLDKDILFKALLNYVEPKLRLEENNLAQLKQRREAVGTTGREGKQLERDLDKQESFLSELYDFRDKLKRAAELNLEPDLNDGVVLNIAPLWELVPWKEAEKYWKELLDGKYEWSSIAKQLRQRGIMQA
jgi:hypothetical protein